jgi:hypothetical protein
MTSRAITALVNRLRELAGDDAKKAVKIIDSAIMGKYKSFYDGN